LPRHHPGAWRPPLGGEPRWRGGRLPLPAAPLGAGAGPDPAGSGGRHVNAAGPTVLLIDDGPQMLRFLRAGLGAATYGLVEVATAREGLAQAAGRNPDLILLDLGLPDGDGLDLTRQIREWSRTPIIIISARGQERDKVAA